MKRFNETNPKRILGYLMACAMVLFSFNISYAQNIVNIGNTFSPDTLTVTVGDSVTFNIDSTHNAVEVDQATWLANGTTSNGGFNIPFGGGTFTPTAAQTYYYVCQPHAGGGMKGVIVASAAPTPTPCTMINVQINTASWANEISWDLTDSNGTILASG